MDGTIYLGGNPFDFAIRFIKNLRASGKKVLFFTNNFSHTTPFYLKKLTRLGFEPSAEEIMTSGAPQPDAVDAAAEADKPDFAFASLADVDELMFG